MSREMPRIRSFAVDHDCLIPGIYVSRADGDAVTYDLRMRRPNAGDYMTPLAMHSLEHMLATYMRSGTLGARVIYVGPMGCRTGFYFLVRNVSPSDAVKLTQDAFKFIADFDGEIPGVSAAECGNYRDHSLEGAKKEAERFLPVIMQWDSSRLNY